MDFRKTNKRQWIAVGDFNVIVNQEEKLGGNPIGINVAFYFTNMMNEAGTVDGGYLGSRYKRKSKDS